MIYSCFASGETWVCILGQVAFLSIVVLGLIVACDKRRPML